MLNNQKGSPREAGAIQLIVILILLAGIVVGVYLVTSGPLKLFPQAREARVSGPIPKPTIKPRPPSAPIPPSNRPSPTKKPRPMF